MTYLISGLLFIQLITNAFGANVSIIKEEFCLDRNDTAFLKDLIKERDNRLYFSNYGGILNGGVCWWHSRMQRNALYLAFYTPNKERPTGEEIKEIINDLRKGKKIIEIRGFDNFYDFSRVNQKEIQKALENWQKLDGVIGQQWVVGLAGRSEIAEEKLEKMMNKLYEYVVIENNIAYQKLQLRGIAAHAWLVYDVEKTDDGYYLYVVDSNYLNPYKVKYVFGDTSFTYGSLGKFVPYTGKKRELKKIKKVIRRYCKGII